MRRKSKLENFCKTLYIVYLCVLQKLISFNLKKLITYIYVFFSTRINIFRFLKSICENKASYKNNLVYSKFLTFFYVK